MVQLDQGGTLRGLRLLPPPAVLQPTVEHLWVQQALPAKTWRVVPDVCGYVIFSVSRSRQGLSARCRVVGARSRFADVPVAGRVLTIGARLRSGSLPLLLRASAAQLCDQALDLESVAGTAGVRLAERMAESSQRDALRLFTEFLGQRFGDAVPSLPPGLLCSTKSVTELGRCLNVSRRGAYDRLLSGVGLPPKLALRIERLHEALHALNGRASLVDAAAHAPFCDQAHFSREATRLLGESPGAWRRRGCSILQDAVRPGAQQCG